MDVQTRFSACLFETIVASHDDAMVSLTPDGLVSSWNPAAERLFGHSPRQALGRPIDSLLVQQSTPLLDRASEAAQALSSPALLRDADGALISALVTRRPLHDPGQGPVGTLVTVHPLRQALSQTQEPLPRVQPINVYESLVESTDDAIITKTLGGIVLSWNPGAQRIFGFSAAEMIGEPITRLIPVERVHEEEMILQRIADGERVEHFETVRVHREGHLVHVSVTISPLRDATGRIVGASKIARDIGERIRAAQTIWRQANQDALTGLPNRHAFAQRLRMEAERARRDQVCFALLYVDLDHFKSVNDSLGHAAGDALLSAVAERMRSALRASDVLARLGGDEFSALLPAPAEAQTARRVGAKLLQALAPSFDIGEHAIHISASIGFALFPHDAEGPENLLRCADLAMYEAKHEGRNRTAAYEPTMDQRARGRLVLAGDLRRASQLGELFLLFQPVVRTADRSLAKFEALLRWKHPAFGVVPPARFIALAEETGLIVELGEWVFRSAAQQALAWQGPDGHGPQVSFNVSPVQLAAELDPTQGWVDYLHRIGLAPPRLVVEVTETVILDESPRIAERLRRLRAQGLQIAVDDFGTGHSNLASLSRVEVDFLKIDQSLVRKLPGDARKLAICEAIVAMSHRLGIGVIAEGIETEEEQARVRDIDCEFAQGYLYARPLDAQAATQWVADDRARLPAHGGSRDLPGAAGGAVASPNAQG